MLRATGWMALALALSGAPARAADEPALELWDERYLTLRAGATAQMTLRATVREGYAVIARAGPGGKLLPLSLRLDKPAQLTVGKPAYPEPEPAARTVPWAAAGARVYRGTIVISFPVTAPPGVEPGQHEIKGLLSYQACDTQRCQPAVAYPVELIVTIRGKSADL